MIRLIHLFFLFENQIGGSLTVRHVTPITSTIYCGPIPGSHYILWLDRRDMMEAGEERMTYECNICLNVNHASRLHCSTCGTIPAQYSILKVPARLSGDYFGQYISVVVAFGADRAEHHRNSKSYMRTVPLDYYASAWLRSPNTRTARILLIEYPSRLYFPRTNYAFGVACAFSIPGLISATASSIETVPSNAAT